MGAHSRPRRTLTQAPATGRHRGQPAPLLDIDLGATAARAGAVLATGATAATVVVAGAGGAGAAPTQVATPSAPAATATAADFAALRQCEASGNYATNTGNGYYGAYQFDLRTWQGLGLSGLPSAASPAVQDQAAQRLEAARGWEPWPSCSRRLGLAASPPAQPDSRYQPVARYSYASWDTTSVHVGGGVAAFPGTTLTTSLESHRRTDVLVWQSRMARRGWHITVDGYYGPQSAHVAAAFATEKHVAAPTGQVTAAVWQAAWTAPIT